MKMPIIVNDNGDITFFANIVDAELYLEADDIYQNNYEVFDGDGNLLKLSVVQNKKKFLISYIQETVQISSYLPNVNKKEYLFRLLLTFCKTLKLNIHKKDNLDDLIFALIHKIGYSK